MESVSPITILLAIAVIFALALAARSKRPSAFGMPVGKIDDVFGVGSRKLRGH